eukprot:TRINITY_DN12782_c0_g2_i1.p1 TRINITY_DN12782_c0_g2~~TRINITY_DN12782_c0_g2_i1.p1  ORF type:complete len:661 (+),score=95.85 TRINITY_DN12782_c0_g2_i1:30-1985(+)
MSRKILIGTAAAVLVVTLALSKRKKKNKDIDFFVALRSEDRKACIPYLAKHSGFILQSDASGNTPLLVACEVGDSEIVAYLLQSGAEIGAINNNGCTVWHMVAISGSMTVFELLSGIDTEKTKVAAVSHGGHTPLHLCAVHGNATVAAKLIELDNTVVDKQNDAGHSALCIAACNGFAGVVTELARAQADCALSDGKGRTALHYAALNGHVDIVATLLKLPTSTGALRLMDKSGYTPLHSACFSGHDAIVEQLLSAGADPNALAKDGSTPLHAVARSGKSNVVTLLQQHRAAPSIAAAFGSTALHIACSTAHSGFVCTLLDHLSKEQKRECVMALDDEGATPLHSLMGSVKHEKTNGPEEILACAQALVAAGADVNALDYGNMTPIYYLVCFTKGSAATSLPVAEYILSQGASVIQEGCQGLTALHLAYRNKAEGHSFAQELVEVMKKNAPPQFLEGFDSSREAQPNSQAHREYLERRGPQNRIPVEVRNSVLQGDLTRNGLVQYMQAHPRKVIVLTGAGISVSAGIPAFRTPTGIYSSTAGRAFDPSTLQTNPEEFYGFLRTTFLPVAEGRTRPTPVHWFIKLLHQKGLLLRNYTQNVDMLERMAGIPSDKLVESHGTFAAARACDGGGVASGKVWSRCVAAVACPPDQQ